MLVAGSLAPSATVEVAFCFHETRRNLDLVHRQMAELADDEIQNYFGDIATAIRLTAHGPEGLTVSARVSATS